MNYLEKMKVYLSGPIQFALDDGVEWRKSITPALLSLNLQVIDPCNKIDFLSEIGDFRKQMSVWRKNQEYDQIVKYMKMIRRWDLRAVDYSNFVIVNVDKQIPTWGTVDECIVAERQKKPILVLSKDGYGGCPDWLFAIAKMHEIFTTPPDIISHLQNINRNGFQGDLRWIKI